MEYHAVVVTALCQLGKVLAGLPIGNISVIVVVPRTEAWETYSRSMVPIEL
jgi:hypothetical protein